MSTLHQNRVEKLECPALSTVEEATLRADLLLVAGQLKARPAVNVDLWNGLGRTEAEVRHPAWLSKLPEVLRSALNAAALEGPAVLQATTHQVEMFYAKLCAFTLAPYTIAGGSELPAALIGLTREAAEVSVAVAETLLDGNETNLRRLQIEVTEEIEEGNRVLDLTSRAIAARRCELRLVAAR